MDRTVRIAGHMLLMAGLSDPAALAGQDDLSEYPGPFPGGYPAMSGIGGSGKMYMESYFPPPVTASPTYPAFSPDGALIAFAYQGRIWAVPAEGGVARQLTSGAGYHSMPSWSSDGRHVAYAADVDPQPRHLPARPRDGRVPPADGRSRDRHASTVFSRRVPDPVHDRTGRDVRPVGVRPRDGNPGVRHRPPAGERHGRRLDRRHGRHRLRLQAGGGGAGLGLAVAMERGDRRGRTPHPHRDELPGLSRRGPARRFGRVRHGRVGEQRHLPGPDLPGGRSAGPLEPGDPAGAAHAHPHGRVLPLVVAGRGAPRLRPKRGRPRRGPDDGRRDGVRALHDGPGRRRARPRADRGLCVVRADGPGPGPRERCERAAAPVPHLSRGVGWTQLLPGRELSARPQRARGLLLPHGRQLLGHPPGRDGRTGGVARIRVRAGHADGRGARR